MCSSDICSDDDADVYFNSVVLPQRVMTLYRSILAVTMCFMQYTITTITTTPYITIIATNTVITTITATIGDINTLIIIIANGYFNSDVLLQRVVTLYRSILAVTSRASSHRNRQYHYACSTTISPGGSLIN